MYACLADTKMICSQLTFDDCNAVGVLCLYRRLESGWIPLVPVWN